jgi:hypothetical protein
VKYVLYYAPANTDSMEKVVVVMKGTSASSEPFVMHPGALSRIAIEDFDGKGLDSIHLNYPTGSKLIIAAGYDVYGNRRGPESSDWSVTGTLHAIAQATNVPQVYYESGQVKYDEDGYIRTVATGPGGITVTDSVHVTITGKPTNLSSIVTQDANGNGYLDRLVLHFDKNVTWPDSGASHFTFSGTTTDPITGEPVTYTLTVDSVAARNGTKTDSVFIVYLIEPKPGDPAYGHPETDWTPKVTISGLSGVAPITSYTASDGAGPVIWSVTKTISSPGVRTQDKVTITFSEAIGTNGNLFNISQAPSSLIRVWQKKKTDDGRDTLVEVTDMLTSIKDFYQVDKNISIEFYMSNDKDLTSLNYLSLVSDSTGKGLSDRQTPANAPVVFNQQVQVVVRSQPVHEILVVPNPTQPTFVRERPGELNLAYQPNARRWIRQDGAGVLLTFKIAPVANQTIRARLCIYDVIGNSVAIVDSLNSPRGIILPSWTTGDTSAYDFDIYWNGSNSQKQKCAAGVYRSILVLKYTDDIKKTSTYSKLQGTVGIQRNR